MSSNVENIYKLTPLQAGMLFHVLYDSSDVNPYVAQSVDEFTGPLDVRRLREAWQAVVDRHTVLRSAFVWEGLDEPLQVVQRRVELPFAELDWRGFPAGEQELRLEELLEQERSRGFNLGSAPLMRLTVVRTADERFVSLWSFHHLLLDGWSTQMVQKQVFTLYRAALEGRQAVLAEAVPYVRYIEWLARQSRPAAEEFWRGYLGSFGEPTQFGAGRAAGDSGFGNVDIELGADVASRLAEFARTHRVTANTVVQGAWALLLSRYSGSDDVVYGSTVSGRHDGLPEAESMIGLFINTLPVRVRVAPDRPVVEWLREVQAQQVELRQYEHTSLTDAQGWSAVPKGEKLFASILLYQNFPGMGTDDLPKGLTRRSCLDVERTGYPITAIVYASGKLNIAYDKSRFDRVTVERMAGHFGVLLRGMVLAGEVCVGELEMLSEVERRQVLVEWNGAVVGVPDGVTLHGLVEGWGRERPGAVAVVCGGESLTYGELNERANRLARHLVGVGVGVGSLVGVCLGRGVDVVVALLGVLKAGGAYVPLDPEYPVDRLAFVLEDTAAVAVVTVEGLRDRLVVGGAVVVCLDGDREVIEGRSGEDLVSGAGPDDVAYVIYTSGSTGVPKGVQVEHRSVVHRLRGTDGDFAFGPEDVWTLFHSFAFDFSVWEIWGALTYGGRLVVVDRDTTRNGEAFVRLLVEQGVTVLNQTPSAFGLLQEWVGRELAGRLALRLVVFGGEALQPARLGPWWEAVGSGGPRLVNMYGITETTVHVTAREISVADTRVAAVSPIGRPLVDTDVFVLDAAGGVVPVGVAGELWVAGAGVARGYLNRPELTAERFVEREIGGRVRRLYRSGDAVRWLPGGELEYLGRLDDQVKIRGFRVELGEIESVLVSHPDVVAGAVLVREDVAGDRRLVGYVVCGGGARLTVGGLRDWCGRSLPDHMVPGAFVLLERLPLTANGKVDRRALPAPEGARLDTGARFVAPRTPVESAIARVWAEVLGVDKVGVHDNFFDLGGDSILSIQVISRARRHGLRLAPRTIFKHQTIAGITANLGEGAAALAEQGAVVGDVELGPVQRWLLAQDFPDHGHFNQHRMLETEGLDAGLLDQALAATIKHHDAFRLRFERGTGSPATWRQHAAEDPVASPLHHADLGGLPEPQLWTRLGEIADEIQRGMDLAAGPVIRAGLFELGRQHGQRLLLAANHLVIDAVSWQILLEDLATAYDCLSAGRDVRLPLKTTSFKEWTGRLARYAAGPEIASEATYWTSRTERPGLPRNRQGVNTFASVASCGATLDRIETESMLRDVPRVFRVRINDILLNAVAHALRAWTGEHEVSIDLEGHGREDLFADVDLSRTIGWFTSMFPVDLRLAPAAEPTSSLQDVKEQLAAVPANGIGYGILRYLGAPDVQERLSALPVPDVSFNYLGQSGNSSAGIGRFADRSEPSGGSVALDAPRAHLIDIVAGVVDGELSFTAYYSEAVHDREVVEELVSGMVSALREVTSSARQRVLSRSSGGDDGAALERYPLSPLQHGIIFHALYDTSESMPYLAQFLDEYVGPFDADAFHEAWQHVVDRHPVLRSSFVWEGLPEPVQVVHEHPRVPFAELDWRGATDEEQARLLEELLATDRSRSFDVSSPPLVRFTVARTADERHLVLWTFHQLLIDGWSGQLVQGEAAALYRAAVEGTPAELDEPAPYGAFITWLGEQSSDSAGAFWRKTLAGLESPTPLGVERETGEDGYGDVRITIAGRQLREAAQAWRVTVNTVVQGAWALLLSRYSGCEEVLFGVTVSGRPADFPRAEETVGPFINTLPMRIAVPAGEELVGWLRQIQSRNVEMRDYGHSSLAEIRSWSDIPAGEAFFRSILVFENYPKSIKRAGLPAGLTRRRLTYVERAGYPLVLAVDVLGDEVGLHLLYQKEFLDPSAVERLAGHLETLIASAVRNPKAQLMDLEMLTESELQQFAQGGFGNFDSGAETS